jgi:SAM-dependent methyltransferase
MARLYKDYRGLDYTALRELYEPDYRRRNEALQGQIEYGESLTGFLCPLLPKRSLAILDWGGDSGKNTPLRSRAKQHDVYDISKAKVIPGARAVTREQASGQNYDLIVCSNVLEHVPYPNALLEDIIHVMAPSTLLYVEVPYEDVMRQYGGNAIAHKKHWHEHVNFFSPRAMNTLLANVGLQVVAASTEATITAGLKSSYMMQVACRLT